MIDILELLIEEQDVPEQVALLREGRDALVARCEALGDLEYPVECTPAIAWAALRESIGQEGYYLSVKELQVLLPACDTLADFYRYQEGSDVSTALVHIEQPSPLPISAKCPAREYRIGPTRRYGWLPRRTLRATMVIDGMGCPAAVASTQCG